MTASHPKPGVVADYLERLARQLRDRGDTAIEMADLLSSRGYPTGGTGNGSRSADATSSTERAATFGAPDDPADGWGSDKWATIRSDLAEDMRKLWYHATRVDGHMSRVLAHATTDDRVPAGTGLCYLSKLCEEPICRPTLKRPDNRLRNGLGPTCHQAWMRYHQTNPAATRQEFLDWRRSTLRATRAVPG